VNKQKAVRNMVVGLVLLGVAVMMGFAAVASIQLVMSLPR
jgi:hypothetical protein